MDDEKWLPVIDYEGWYEISNYGEVRRVLAAMKAAGVPVPQRWL